MNNPEVRPLGVNQVNEPLNVGSHGMTETERLLSNFAETPFELDGKRYRTVESFWQGLYFPEGSEARALVADLTGREAKKAGREQKRKVTSVSYQGKNIEIGSPEHHELMRRALQAKFRQNEQAAKLLVATGERPITHIMKAPDGRILPDSKSIPGAVFSQMLMDLREEFRNSNFIPN